jgi:hypothetical protein
VPNASSNTELGSGAGVVVRWTDTVVGVTLKVPFQPALRAEGAKANMDDVSDPPPGDTFMSV